MSGAPVVVSLGAQKMIPLRAETVEDVVQIALYNLRHFDHVAFARWLSGQSASIQRLAGLRGPCALYQLMTDSADVVLGVVIGYRAGVRGEAALCAVQVLGVWDGNGSYGTPLFLPAEILVDVTDAGRAGKLALR